MRSDLAVDQDSADGLETHAVVGVVELVHPATALRAPTWSDLFPQNGCARRCQRMIREAEVADVFMRRQRRAHPFWGNGSLMSAARKRLLPDEPSFDDADYCMCFETVLRCLIDRQINSEHS